MNKILTSDLARMTTLLNELKAREISFIRNPHPATKYSVPGKIEAYIQTVLRRCTHLVDSSALMLENQKGLSAVILARSLLETIASLVWFQAKLNGLVHKRDFEGINLLINRVAYSAWWHELRSMLRESESVKTKNINDPIRLLEKHDQDIYDILSEHSHPNALGTFRFFSQADNETNDTYHFNNGDLNFDEASNITLSVIKMASTIFLNTYDQVKQSLPEINQLYEDSLLIKKH